MYSLIKNYKRNSPMKECLGYHHLVKWHGEIDDQGRPLVHCGKLKNCNPGQNNTPD